MGAEDDDAPALVVVLDAEPVGVPEAQPASRRAAPPTSAAAGPSGRLTSCRRGSRR
ncbi:MAG: hypothetical protein PGN11_00950 [Quadrisphaera sp.]